jgi:uroporphyrinogen-III synthase
VAPPPARVAVVATVEAAAAWVAAIRQTGIVATAAPFARVTTPRDPSRVAMALGSRRHALVLATSSNAVRFVPADVGFGRAAAAVGVKTAKALRDRGFRVEVQGDAGAESLARAIVASGPPRSVLWLRGERAREEGVEILRAAGFVVDEVESYRTEPVPDFAATIAALGTPSAWVLGSPAAVEALAGTGALSDPVSCVAVGETTAAALHAAGVPAVAVAAEPTPEAIATAVTEICRPR